MTGRDDILASIRQHKLGFSAPAPEVPNYDEQAPRDTQGLIQHFIAALNTMNGVWAEPEAGESPDQTMRRLLSDYLDDNSTIVSTSTAIQGNRRLAADQDPASLHDVDIAVVPARFGIAETGSVVFTEDELVVNTLAYLAQHLVVILDPADIEINLHHAYRRTDFQDAHYTVFHTGPSATADIQGVLIRGAQGVRSLTVIPVG